jgi:hypothetical protein
MRNLSAVVEELKTERKRAQEGVQCIDAALAALGSLSSNGLSRQHTIVRCSSSENRYPAESTLG